MEDFQRALEDCRLHDLGFKGPKYTWSNGRHGRDYTLERLNKVVANVEWSAIWSDAGLDVLACHSSDHHPLRLTMNKNGATTGKK